MDARRQKRKMKKKSKKEQIPCIVYLSSKEDRSFELAEKKEDRQLRYINEYADAHGLIPMKIIRNGCFGPSIRNKLFQDCIHLMRQGKARALLVANMDAISSGIADAYRKVGMVQEQGFRLISVDEGELQLNMKSLYERMSV